AAPPAGGLAPPSIDVFDPSFHSPRTQQYNLQIEHALTSSYAITVGYLGVHALHLTRSRDINLYPMVLATGSIAGGGSVQYYTHPGGTAPVRPYSAFGRITVFESGADSTYN